MLVFIGLHVLCLFVAVFVDCHAILYKTNYTFHIHQPCRAQSRFPFDVRHQQKKKNKNRSDIQMIGNSILALQRRYKKRKKNDAGFNAGLGAEPLQVPVEGPSGSGRCSLLVQVRRRSRICPSILFLPANAMRIRRYERKRDQGAYACLGSDYGLPWVRRQIVVHVLLGTYIYVSLHAHRT